jgi:hypothetical protein
MSESKTHQIQFFGKKKKKDGIREPPVLFNSETSKSQQFSWKNCKQLTVFTQELGVVRKAIFWEFFKQN